jgi:hypothetical protein
MSAPVEIGIVLRVIVALALLYRLVAQAFQRALASSLLRYAPHYPSNLFVRQTLPPQLECLCVQMRGIEILSRHCPLSGRLRTSCRRGEGDGQPS